MLDMDNNDKLSLSLSAAAATSVCASSCSHLLRSALAAA